MDHRLSNIERLCRLFLHNFEHVSRRERTEKIIEDLHEATTPLPPTLGISVSDGVGSSSKFGG